MVVLCIDSSFPLFAWYLITSQDAAFRPFALAAERALPVPVTAAVSRWESGLGRPLVRLGGRGPWRLRGPCSGWSVPPPLRDLIEPIPRGVLFPPLEAFCQVRVLCVSRYLVSVSSGRCYLCVP